MKQSFISYHIFLAQKIKKMNTIHFSKLQTFWILKNKIEKKLNKFDKIMTTDLEKYLRFRNNTEEAFNQWNDKQPDNRKIHNRLPFSVEFLKVKFSEGFEKKAYVGKDGKPGNAVFKKIKHISPQGGEVSAKVQSPSVIAPRGYCNVKTDSGEIKSIICVYDTENPEHKRFIDNIENDITTPAIHEIIKYPGTFGFQEFPPIETLNEQVMQSELYKSAVSSVRTKMAKIVNRIKINKNTVDFSSPLRTVFFSPLYFKDPEKPNDPPVEMAVYLKTVPGQPARVITPSQLFQICEGYEPKEVVEIVDGVSKSVIKMVKGSAKGMECSPEGNFGKLTTKPSTKLTCTSITITRFQIAPKNNTQEGKLKYVDEYGVEDTFTSQMNMDSLLEGLSNALPGVSSNGQVPVGNTFNPMGVDAGVSNPPTIGSSSLIAAAQASSFQSNQEIASQYHHHDNLQIKQPTSQSNINMTLPEIKSSMGSSGFGIQQQSMPPIPPPISSANFGTFPAQVQSNMMPNSLHSVNLGLMSGSDRIQTFNGLGGTSSTI